MEIWIKNNFNVEKDYYGEKRMYFTFEGKLMSMNYDFFIDYTSKVEIPVTLQKLKNIDPKDKIGWHLIFEEWDKQGKFN